MYQYILYNYNPIICFYSKTTKILFQILNKGVIRLKCLIYEYCKYISALSPFPLQNTSQISCFWHVFNLVIFSVILMACYALNTFYTLSFAFQCKQHNKVLRIVHLITIYKKHRLSTIGLKRVSLKRTIFRILRTLWIFISKLPINLLKI